MLPGEVEVVIAPHVVPEKASIGSAPQDRRTEKRASHGDDDNEEGNHKKRALRRTLVLPSSLCQCESPSAMNLEVVRFRELTAAHVARWAEWQATDPALASPYFRPEFTEVVAARRADTLVAVIDDGRAFFPFERGLKGIGRAAGGILSDYHGVIAQPGFFFDPLDIVQRCGLRAWDFDHVPAAQSAFAPWAQVQTGSPLIDLRLPAAGASAKLREQTARSRRKLAREVGAVEFEMDSADDAAFERLLAWKSAQYLASGAVDLFKPGWIRNVVTTLRSFRDVEFSGVLSVLRVGGCPIAAHFGLRSRGLLHYWFPAYDPAFSALSPGMMLLLDVIDAAPAHGIGTIDFGKGDAAYKLRVANSRVPLMEGGVIASPWLRIRRRSHAAMDEWFRRSPLLPLARRIRRSLRGGQ
jgi:CelD/BcsL family acetyltransferase involved in cellulose biosynthesis